MGDDGKDQGETFLHFKSLVVYFSKILIRKLISSNSSWNPQLIRSPSLHRRKSSSNVLHQSHIQLQKQSSLNPTSDDDNQTFIFHVEGSLFKSSCCMFPYFMLVAFEAGGFFRALLLLILYPLISFLDQQMGLQIMVMICFFGIREDSFRVGRAVLPKFFLEDVGFEAFQVLMRGGKKVGVSDFPTVMIESFLKDYLEIEFVVGRELKTFKGYYLGLMKNKKQINHEKLILNEIFGDDQETNDGGDDQKDSHHQIIGIIGSFNKPLLDHHLFSHCKEIYIVSEAERRSWNYLPRSQYPKPLIFHDGRLALRPTPLNSLSIFIWLPFGFFLAIFRALFAISLPYTIAAPLLAFLGLRLNFHQNSTTNPKRKKGILYVCNHKTLLDPLYLSHALSTPITAVTYSLSRISEVLAPIRTVRLTRDRAKDAKMMENMLSEGDLIVCPEGTTCREPYLLRFSPLFAEMCDEIVPVAMDARVTMFYGTTAGGLKCFDPLFFLMNPSPSYSLKVLDTVSGAGSGCDESTRFKVANHIQNELGQALGYECTKLTRKDKYLILAGNEGIVKAPSKRGNSRMMDIIK